MDALKIKPPFRKRKGKEEMDAENEKQERMFTQAEVEAIVKQRLSRARTDAADLSGQQQELDQLRAMLDTREKELSARELAVMKAEKALEFGLPLEMAPRLQGTDAAALETDAKALAGYLRRLPVKAAPLFVSNYGSGTPGTAAFAPNYRRKPAQKN